MRQPTVVLGHVEPLASGGSAGCAAEMRRLRSSSAGVNPRYARVRTPCQLTKKDKGCSEEVGVRSSSVSAGAGVAAPVGELRGGLDAAQSTIAYGPKIDWSGLWG